MLHAHNITTGPLAVVPPAAATARAPGAASKYAKRHSGCTRCLARKVLLRTVLRRQGCEVHLSVPSGLRLAEPALGHRRQPGDDRALVLRVHLRAQPGRRLGVLIKQAPLCHQALCQQVTPRYCSPATRTQEADR